MIVSLSGDHQFCGLSESNIRSTVGYTLSNSPLKRIDKDSMDVIGISIIAQRDQTKSGRTLGCSVAVNFELWRFVNFKGRNNLVTVWSKSFLQGGQEDQMGGLINSLVETTTKDFVVNWVEKN